MTDAQYYTIIAVSLVGILMNGVLFVYLGSRMDKVIEHMNDIRERVAVLEQKVKGVA
jgi:uncharacterized protein YoxC